jgi:hypothetical protein
MLRAGRRLPDAPRFFDPGEVRGSKRAELRLVHAIDGDLWREEGDEPGDERQPQGDAHQVGDGSPPAAGSASSVSSRSTARRSAGSAKMPLTW